MTRFTNMHPRIQVTLVAIAVAALSQGQSPEFTSPMMLSAWEPWGSVLIYGEVMDPLGNSYLTGEFEGTVDLGGTQLQSAYSDAFVAKLDPLGNWLWCHRLGSNTSNLEYGGAIALDGNGGLYFTSYVSSWGLMYDSLPITFPYTDGMCVAKLDTSGTWQWFAAADIWAPSSVLTVDPSGAVYVSGDWNSAGEIPQFGPFTLPSGISIDTFIAKVDQNGTWQWAKALISGPNGALEVMHRGATLSMTGDLIIAGVVQGHGVDIDGMILSANPDNEDFQTLMPYVAAWSPSGSLLWATTIDNVHMGNFEIESICGNPAGGTHVIGLVTDTADFGPFQVINVGSLAGGQTLANIDDSGAWTSVQSSDQVGGLILDMLTLDNDDLLCVGTFHNLVGGGFGPDSLIVVGQQDAFVGAFSTMGQWLGGSAAGAPDFDWATTISRSGSLARATGIFSGMLTIGGDTLNCPGQSCSFISTVLGNWADIVEPDNRDLSTISLSPVPVGSVLHVKIDADLLGLPYHIIDFQGKTHFSGTLTQSSSEISVGGLTAGAYLLRTGRSAARFIKE